MISDWWKKMNGPHWASFWVASSLIDPTKVTSTVKFVSSTLIEISSEIQDRTVESLRQDYLELEMMLINEILPRDGRYIYDGDAADEFFNTYDRVGGIVTGR